MSAPPEGTVYHRVERLHLRQWALRAVVPLALVATNGATFAPVAGLPAHDCVSRALGLPDGAEPAVRAAGGALVVASAVLRVLAKGVLVRKTTVTRVGVYGWVRHPFYLANLVGAAGVFLLAGSLGAAVGAAWLAVALPVYPVTVAGEERGLRAIHGAAWDDYAAAVPRLLPRGLRGAPGGRVTWANLVTEGEPPRGLRFLAGALLVAGAGTPGTAGTAMLCAAAAGFAASHVVARARRRAAE